MCGDQSRLTLSDRNVFFAPNGRSDRDIGFPGKHHPWTPSIAWGSNSTWQNFSSWQSGIVPVIPWDYPDPKTVPQCAPGFVPKTNGMDVHSLAVDPQFEDLDSFPRNVALKPTSPALALGFKQLPPMDAPTLKTDDATVCAVC
jgi:hypothetical protein